jgi:phosphoserine phosphatase RsbU/P
VLRGTQSIEVPDAGGVPIAIMDDASYEEGCVQLQAADRVCLYTDGILEQSDPTGEQFGTERILQSLISRTTEPSEQVVDGVVDDLAAWAGSRNFTDDVSLALIEWLG